MRMTIIPSDGCVIVDGINKYQPLDLSRCNVPRDVHALQWFETKGWIEFSDDGDPFTPKPANEMIGNLPGWAINCYNTWQAWVPPTPTEEPAPVV